MSKSSDLVKGFRANVKEGIPTIMVYDGRNIKLNCSPNINGYVGLTTAPNKYDTCEMEINCKECHAYKSANFTPTCKYNLAKPVL